MQFDAQSRLEKGTRHPGGREPQQTARPGNLGFNFGLSVALDRFELGDRIHGRRCLCLCRFIFLVTVTIRSRWVVRLFASRPIEGGASLFQRASRVAASPLTSRRASGCKGSNRRFQRASTRFQARFRKSDPVPSFTPARRGFELETAKPCSCATHPPEQIRRVCASTCAPANHPANAPVDRPTRR